MSGFSAEWLALREPADHAARHPGLLEAVAAAFAGRERTTILDLGCGAGSNLRGLAPRLGSDQDWILVDHDTALLAAARDALAAWARESQGSADNDADRLVLTRHGQRIAVRFRQADLAGDWSPLLDLQPDLVTAAALFDLVSETWLRRFSATLAERRLPLYAVLTYDGMERWQPGHPLDEAILGAFHRHQGRDKGFGPSAGPRAVGALAASLAKLGYRVSNGDSPWRLGAAESALVAMLAEGVAGAASETGLVGRADAMAWAQARREAIAVEIGHRDLLAFPPAWDAL